MRGGLPEPATLIPEAGLSAPVEPLRTLTPAEAKAAIPRLRPLLAQLREAFHEYRFATQQVQDLRGMYGDAVFAPDHDESEEALLWQARERDTNAEVERLLGEVHALGAEVKDPVLGLVDFYAVRPTGETVHLCYRDDEETITHWHPLVGGYAARRPLSEF